MKIIHLLKINKNGEEVKYLIFNNIKFRQYFKTQYYNESYKVNMFLHQYIYCYFNNLDKIPKGYVIHHKDFNKINNDISNLELMTVFEHKSLHGIGKKHALKKITQEMIDDVIKNKITMKNFKLKYNYGRSIWNKIKNKI